jgi:iron complex transport system ATP-binding protein
MRKPALAVYGMDFRYPGADAPAVRELSFELETGQCLALLGPNGCGKSTLLKLITGILPLRGGDAGGQVKLLGADFLSQAVAARARQVAYVGYDLRAEFPLTAEEAVWLGRTVSGTGLLRHVNDRDRAAVHSAMERCLCLEFAGRDLFQLSGGQRQLVALARALAQGARILCLDESLSQMDLNHQAVIGKLLRQLCAEGHSVILVSHDVNLASEWADTCLLMKAGAKIAQGPVAKTLTQETIRTLYPGAELFVGANPATGAPKVFFGSGESND